MATTITDDCISCGACEPECPNNAISQADPIYVINPQLCTECVGFHDFEACAAVCPVDCCVTDPKNVESESVLIERARALHQEMDFGDNFPSRFRKAEAAAAAPPSADSAPAASAPAQADPPGVVAEPIAKPAVSAPASETKPAPAPKAETQLAENTNAQASVAPEVPPAAPKPAAPVAAKAAPAAAASKPAQPLKPKKTFAQELPVSFEELSKRYGGGGSLSKGIGKFLVIAAQPLLGALPHKAKTKLELAVQSPLFTAGGSTGLNIVQNAVLYPLICMGIAAAARGPAVLFSQAIDSYVFLGFLIAAAEAAYRLKDGILSPGAADTMSFRAAFYGAPLGLLLKPVLDKQAGLVRELPIPVDGFYSEGFVDKLERERRYGNVYTVENRGGALLLRMQFPRFVPDAGLRIAAEPPRPMPDYDYDLALKDGTFVIKARCADEQVRKISSSVGAFPPEFTTVIPLREKITGFAHRYEKKILEVLLLKDSGGHWSESHR